MQSKASDQRDTLSRCFRVKTLRIMRLSAVLLIAAGLHVSAVGISQTVTISPRGTPLRAMSLERIFADIRLQTGYHFFYRNEDLAGTRPVSVRLENVPLRAALEKILNDQPLTFEIQGNTIFITRKTVAIAPGSPAVTDETPALAPGDIHGRVTNANGEPVAGATVVARSSRKIAIADNQGEFRLEGIADNETLVISSVGYEPRTVILKGKKDITIQLDQSQSNLDQVQVIAYGTTTRGKLISSISTVRSEDIRNLPVTSFDQMLQGLAAGVLVSNSSGAPGKTANTTIRGQNSINAGGPLYVIDGTPINSNNLGPLDYNLDPFTGINPDDIASIDILKDAGATAIYGSRAANGVILITTKRGKEGKASFTLNAMQGAGIPTGRLHLLGTKNWLALQREAFRNDNPGTPLPDELVKVDSTTNTDWQSLVYKPTTIGEYKMSMSGGSAATQYYMSGGYRKETNPLSGRKGLERGTFRLNLDNKASSRLNISASLGASRDVNQNTQDAANSYSAVDAALQAPPNMTPYDSAGNFTIVPIASGGVGNPLAIFKSKLDNTTTQIKTSVHIDYAIWKGLSFHTDLGNDYNSVISKVYFPKAVNAVIQNPLYDARITNEQVNTYSVEPQLRYNRTFRGDHQVEAVAGSTLQNTSASDNTTYGKGFASDNLQELGAAATTFGTSTTTQYSFTSLFGRLNYTYMSRYLVSGTFRRDGSSRFGPDNKFGNFWSLSGGWIFSREKLFRHLSFLTLGKLRSSYGIVGSDAIGDYTYLDQWTTSVYGAQPALNPFSAENPNVQWERTAKFDIGLDLGLLHDRVGMTVNYFSNRTDNLLVVKSLPSQTGFTAVAENLPAVVMNRGTELELNTVNIRTGGFQWTTKFNLTWQKNELSSFPGLATASSYNRLYQVGQPLSLLWGYKFRGVDRATGTPVYDGFNLDGSPSNKTDLFPGYQIIGRNSPDYFGGFVNNFSWKGWSLDVFFQFVHGTENRDLFNTLNNSSTSTANQEAGVLRRWQKPGDITQTPRAATIGYAWWVTSGIDEQSSRFVSDASYWRVKNITLAYTLPPELTSRLKLRSVRFYATAQNLAVFTRYRGVDPETGSNVAPVRMIVGGMNLNF
jgi:TonB-linked SusC/RagA family outer membrane protein